ncbi:MAG: MarR family transcriptional regulator [Candidatus Micrarchaeota archaeon]
MIDFACKQFNLDDIIKCSLGLTRAEFRILQFFVQNHGQEFAANMISRRTKLNLTTIQKAVKKLAEKKVILRSQRNLDSGGYIFLYRCNSKENIRGILKAIIRRWSRIIEDKIDGW